MPLAKKQIAEFARDRLFQMHCGEMSRHPDGQIRSRSLQILEKALILADSLGVRTIQLAGYDMAKNAIRSMTTDYRRPNI